MREDSYRYLDMDIATLELVERYLDAVISAWEELPGTERVFAIEPKGIISMGRHVVVRIVTTLPWCVRVPIHRGDWPRAELFAAASPAAFLCLDLLKPYPA